MKVITVSYVENGVTKLGATFADTPQQAIEHIQRNHRIANRKTHNFRHVQTSEGAHQTL